MIDREGESLTNAIIFCNRKTDVDICAKSLKKYGYDAAAIHGDLDQAQRTRTLDGFRGGELRILVASDVAARGLDVPSVSHVFNYDVPGHAEDYVHRIGRTGRAGRSGKAITICEKRDDKALKAVEDLIQKQIPTVESPFKPDEKPEPVAKAEPKERKPKADRAETPDAQEPREKPARSRDNRRDRNDNRGNRSDNKVVGFGDHMPSFVAASFADRKAS